MTIPACCNAFAIERVKKWTTLIFAVSTFAWQIQDIVHCLKGSKAVEEKGEKASLYLYVVSEWPNHTISLLFLLCFYVVCKYPDHNVALWYPPFNTLCSPPQQFEVNLGLYILGVADNNLHAHVLSSQTSWSPYKTKLSRKVRNSAFGARKTPALTGILPRSIRLNANQSRHSRKKLYFSYRVDRQIIIYISMGVIFSFRLGKLDYNWHLMAAIFWW